LIEDGDFDIPSAYLRQEEGKVLLTHCGKIGHLVSRANRLSTESVQLLARKGDDSSKRYVLSAHIDAKIGTPGAIDNATGVVLLLLLAHLLSDYDGDPVIELLPFNGEDYYSAPGQVLYLDQNREMMDAVKLNINIDGAGFYQGPTAISLFDLPTELEKPVRERIANTPGIQEGVPWYQGDHSVFIQQGVPAIAVTSQWFLDHIDSQELTHTPADHPGIVDCQKISFLAEFLSAILMDQVG
jgi:aminopeptidase YwaD